MTLLLALLYSVRVQYLGYEYTMPYSVVTYLNFSGPSTVSQGLRRPYKTPDIPISRYRNDNQCSLTYSCIACHRLSEFSF